MKNVKLFLSTVVAFLVVGISTVSAQQKQSVIISETIYTNITIEVIKPDYTVEKQSFSLKEDNGSVVLKKELDKWREQGFEVIDSSIASSGTNKMYTIIYFLTKKD